MKLREFLFLILAGQDQVQTRRIQIEENLEKIISIEDLRSKNQKSEISERIQPSIKEDDSYIRSKEPQNKVENLLGSQKSETNSKEGAVYRISCWDATGEARAGCIYQAPNRFSHGSVSHFWLASENHAVRWIHFYDANIVPGSSNPYTSDFSIAHKNPNFVGVDYVNFIVMFENIGKSTGSTTGSIPDDNEWIVYSDPAETYETSVFSFPSNYEGNNARTSIKPQKGFFLQDDIVLIKFPTAVKNLHFDTIEGMGVNGVEGPEHFAEMVTLTNIPSYVNEIWFDFEYFESEKENGVDPGGNWFDATMITVNIY